MTRRERMQRRLERREVWAGSASARSDAAFSQAGKMAEAIPFGQPILVGHHSEGRDRRYRGRMHAKMDRGLAEHRKAEHHASKARGLAIALERSIFDDDPDAIERLQEKVANLEASCEQCVAMNRAWRKGGQEAIAAEFGPELAAAAAKVMSQCRWLKAPFTTTNDRAEVRRCKQRIELIQRQRARAAEAEQSSGGVALTQSHGWAVVTFAEKPARSVLDALRSAGFHWRKGSWQGSHDKLPACVRELLGARGAELVEEPSVAELGLGVVHS